MSSIVIAIDGPAASGKGTVSKAISEKLKFHYLDTGKIYRAIGAKYIGGHEPIYAAKNLKNDDLDSYDLQKPEVRASLLKFQRNFSKKMPGAVLDGRDIGTIVCPDAQIKIFLTASLEARAYRRYLELQKTDKELKLDTIIDQIVERDQRDKTRSSSPLIAANDAKVFDTSDLSIKEAIDHVLDYIQTKI